MPVDRFLYFTERQLAAPRIAAQWWRIASCLLHWDTDKRSPGTTTAL